jgi:hypothetical protein
MLCYDDEGLIHRWSGKVLFARCLQITGEL